MITSEEKKYIAARAYVPEHLPGYVTSITQAEPFLIDDFLFYLKGTTLIFVGYPLSGRMEEAFIQQVLEKAREYFKPAALSMTAPVIPVVLEISSNGEVSEDSYYRLDLNEMAPSKKLRSLLKRASRDLILSEGGSFSKEHSRLIGDFTRLHSLDQGTCFIFEHVPEYVRSGSGWILEARNRDGELVALDIVDYSAAEYAFYMFNFYSRNRYVPGASDLLLDRLVERAREQGKRYINLGLGISPGVTFFKNKWGAEAFLPQRACRLETQGRSSFESLIDILIK